MFRSKRKRNLEKIAYLKVSLFLLFARYGEKIKDNEIDMTEQTENLVGKS